MAEAHQLRGDTPEALEWLVKATDLWPDDLRVRLELAELLYVGGDPRRSLFPLEAAYRQNPDMEERDLAHVHFSRGLILLRSLGQRGEALYNFEQAIAVNPGHPQAAAIQGTILELRSEGVEPVPDATSRQPTDAD